LCDAHYQRQWTTGDPGPPEIGRPLLTTYKAVHDRLRRTRGPAAAFRCHVCWHAAKQWAYDHTDPAELTEIFRGKTLTYSASLARYIPLCRSCHAQVDACFIRARRIDVARCVELYKRFGFTIIARMLGCSPDTVRKALRESGVTIRPSGGSKWEHCGRRHRTAAPNLAKQGRCLACERARRNARDARSRGEVWTEAQMQARADAHYARIMSGSEPDRYCRRRHRLAGANHPRRGCLACARATDNARDAKRRGEVWSEQQIQARADAQYACIMQLDDGPGA